MKVNNYPVKTPEAGDKLFGSDSSGDQVQFDMTNVSNNVFTYEIGEYVEDEGGVIFHRYLDGSTQNYLVISITDQSTGQAYSNVASTLIGASAQSTWDGLSNSNAIVAQSGFTNGAAKTCLDLTTGSKSDWYLPAVDELSLIWKNRFNVNKTLSGNSSFGTILGATQIDYDYYWSSTEFNNSNAWGFSFYDGVTNATNKVGTYYVRAVRKFSI
jgi:hypothetical protein